MYSARRRFGDQERERLAATIDAVYADFVGKVAAGRGRSTQEIEAVARGRVWSGRDGLATGLVDQLGGLREALAEARTRGDLPDDAPVQPAGHVPMLARLGRPRNSEDRALLQSSWSATDLPAGLGVLDGPRAADARDPPALSTRLCLPPPENWSPIAYGWFPPSL